MKKCIWLYIDGEFTGSIESVDEYDDRYDFHLVTCGIMRVYKSTIVGMDSDKNSVCIETNI